VLGIDLVQVAADEAVLLQGADAGQIGVVLSTRRVFFGQRSSSATGQKNTWSWCL